MMHDNGILFPLRRPAETHATHPWAAPCVITTDGTFILFDLLGSGQTGKSMFDEKYVLMLFSNIYFVEFWGRPICHRDREWNVWKTSHPSHATSVYGYIGYHRATSTNAHRGSVSHNAASSLKLRMVSYSLTRTCSRISDTCVSGRRVLPRWRAGALQRKVPCSTFLTGMHVLHIS